MKFLVNTAGLDIEVASNVMLAAMAVFMLRALSVATSPVTAFALICTALAILSLYTSISGLFKAELFPSHVRALGVGLAHSVSIAVFGGTAEYVALSCKSAGHEPRFFWYVAGVCGVAFVTTLFMREPRRASMSG